MNHQLSEVKDVGRFVAACSCGWRSSPAITDAHAERRFWIHASQRRAAESCAHAWALGTSTVERMVELAEMRDAVRARRTVLAERRVELRSALDRAALALRPTAPSVRTTLECARQLAGLTVDDLWMRYFGYGGQLGPHELQQVLAGERSITRSDYSVLAVVLNEHFRDSGFGNPLPHNVPI